MAGTQEVKLESNPISLVGPLSYIGWLSADYSGDSGSGSGSSKGWLQRENIDRAARIPVVMTIRNDYLPRPSPRKKRRLKSHIEPGEYLQWTEFENATITLGKGQEPAANSGLSAVAKKLSVGFKL